MLLGLRSRAIGARSWRAAGRTASHTKPGHVTACCCIVNASGSATSSRDATSFTQQHRRTLINMSSSEENFDIDNVSGSESEDYAPAPKKTKAPAKKPASKATTSKASTSKVTKVKAPAKPKASAKKVLTDIDDNIDESVVDIAVQPDDEETIAMRARAEATEESRKKKTASEMYTKLSQLEHILLRPDSYIGSVEKVTANMWVIDSDCDRMVQREITYVPGFFKIVDEILVNAADNKINDPSMNTLKVDIDTTEGTISVWNNGKGIPIEMHSREKMWIPELIFGHLLSSSNYDDNEKKLTGGRNGYGAKLANIYSHEFTVETADKKTSQKYKQTWTNNMTKVGKAKITANNKSEEYTQVSFRPELERFGMDSIDEDTLALLKRRVYDMAGTIDGVKVYLNKKVLKIKDFKSYVGMYLQSVTPKSEDDVESSAPAPPKIIHEKIGERWEIAFAPTSDGSFQQVSFANSIATTKGGNHVTYIADKITKRLVEEIKKKNKHGAPVQPSHVKQYMWVFVKALVENPSFDSQTKEYLTLQASKFGTRPEPSTTFMNAVVKSGIIETILDRAMSRADQQLKKTDGGKRSRLTGVAKLDDANNAGGRNASKCTLILTEGDSAKALAVAGLGVVGRDNFGVFPLRGKMLNVREAKHDQIMKNEEIQNIKKIMGLQHNKEYTSTSSLRYGRLMIMTDQDHDGSHIKGLLINYLDHSYPSLLKIPDFLVEFVTPIVRVTKGKQRRDFFTIPEYEKWLEETPDAHKWTSKYYKGLGTSKDSDAREYFANMEKHMIPFATTQPGDRDLIDLAFNKKKADERKEWLRQLKPGTYLDHNMDEIPFSEFINKELILFSMADNVRSIPSVADGLKPGQRKVIWGCFKRNLKSEIKVAQLVGYISEHAAYHHGEQSLTSTIVNLAQDYVGSNNLNLLLPNGQFGTRSSGGKDHAAPRYIFTETSPLARAIFHPADDPLLKYLKDDNDLIEPEYYMPVIPLVLVNGADGIGTGWSTNVPCYNPMDIVANIRRLMAGEEMVPMLPWWRGFKGTIKRTGDNKYDISGIVNKINDTTVEITELPIYKWTLTMKADLEKMFGEKMDGPVKDVKEHHDNVNVHFVVHMSAKALEAAEKEGLLEYFKLTTKLTTTNMICFDLNGKIKRYDSPEHILEDFYPARLAFYQKRKDHMASELQLQHERLSNQARFVRMIVERLLNVSNRKKADIVEDLRKKDFRPFPKVVKAKAAGETAPVVDPEDEDGSEDGPANLSDYDYLLGMPIWNLTKEKIAKLEKQAADKEAELLALLEKTPIDLWNTDLDQFLAQWEESCREFEEKSTKDNSGKKVKRKQTTLKTRKSLSEPMKFKDEDSDEDEYKPTTKVTTAKSKQVSKPAALKAEDDDDDDVVIAAANKKRAPAASKKKTLKEESDSGSDFETKVVVTKKPSAAAAQKRKAKPESDSDEEVIPKPASKKPTTTITKKPVKVNSDVEIEDEEEEEKKPVVAPKGKGKATAAASKRKSPDNDEDSDDSIVVKPARKKPTTQSSVMDFFDAVPDKSAPSASKKATTGSSKSASKPASKPAASKPKLAKKKKVVESESEEESEDEAPSRPAPPARSMAQPSRTARAAATKKKYVELDSEDDDDNGGDNGDDSMFLDDD